MRKVVQIGGRKIEWVREEPGPVLIVFIALVFILSAACLSSATDDVAATGADISVTR